MEVEAIAKVRSVLGADVLSDSQIMTVLSHCCNNLESAINYILNNPGIFSPLFTVKRTVTTTGARFSCPIKQENGQRSEDTRVKEEPGVYNYQVNDLSPKMMSFNELRIATSTRVIADEEYTRFRNDQEMYVGALGTLPIRACKVDDKMPEEIDGLKPMIRAVKEESGVGNYQVNNFSSHMTSFDDYLIATNTKVMTDEEYLRFMNRQGMTVEPIETLPILACKVDDKMPQGLVDGVRPIIQAVKEEPDIDYNHFDEFVIATNRNVIADEEYMRFQNKQEDDVESLKTFPILACKVDDKISEEEGYKETSLMDGGFKPTIRAVKEELYVDNNQVNISGPKMMSFDEFLIATNTKVMADEEYIRFQKNQEMASEETTLIDGFGPMVPVKEEPFVDVTNNQVNISELKRMSFDEFLIATNTKVMADEEYMRFLKNQEMAIDPLTLPCRACKVVDKLPEEGFEETTLMGESKTMNQVKNLPHKGMSFDEFLIATDTKVMADEEYMRFQKIQEMVVDEKITKEDSLIRENEPGLHIVPVKEDVHELQVYKSPCKKKSYLEGVEEEDKMKPRPADTNNMLSTVRIEDGDFPEEPDCLLVGMTSVVSLSTTIVIEDRDFPDVDELQVSKLPYKKKRSLEGVEEEDKKKPRPAGNHNMLSTIVIEDGDFPEEPDWLLVGRTSVVSLSTTTGRKLENNEIVHFTFPNEEKLCSMAASSKAIAAASTTVRFSTKRSGQIGKLNPEWTSFLIPLVCSSNVKIRGRCIAAPMDLSYYQDIILYVSFYINRSVFSKSDVSLCEIDSSNIHSAAAVAPLMKLFNLLKIKPSTDAIFTPGDFDPKKCVINTQEMEAPSTLCFGLKSNQKQALYWMTQLEKGVNVKTIHHPFWEEYKLCNENSIYVNIFSGEATTEFPKSTETTRGGILADAMGLGKTVLMISLIFSRALALDINKNNYEEGNRSKVKGGTLVICPIISLVSQWKDEIEKNSKAGAIRICADYGGYRSTNDPKMIGEYDVVLTSYGVVTEASKNDGENSIFNKVEWSRVVLDEAHSTINSWKTIGGIEAILKLSSECRWCLTDDRPPIEDNLEEVYSLLCFLRVEPWCSNRSWWDKTIQRAYESGDPKVVKKIVRGVLGPIMVRTEDKDKRYTR